MDLTSQVSAHAKCIPNSNQPLSDSLTEISNFGKVDDDGAHVRSALWKQAHVIFDGQIQGPEG